MITALILGFLVGHFFGFGWGVLAFIGVMLLG
jgi:hypothetical protein